MTYLLASSAAAFGILGLGLGLQGSVGADPSSVSHRSLPAFARLTLPSTGIDPSAFLTVAEMRTVRVVVPSPYARR
ncbi:hypothetical protein [Methylobacterium brachiatum]